MLENLVVENFAIIDRIELNFYPGLTVITGETGAGKSILVDAISLLLGERASQEMIRTGKDKALVKGRFRITDPDLKIKLMHLGVDVEKDEIEICREVTMQNRNLIKINKQSLTLQQLNEITASMADIHSQFDTQRLLSPQNYLELIDNFRPEKINVYKSSYQTELKKLRELKAELEKCQKLKQEYLEKREMIDYQRQELEKYNLDVAELEILNNDLDMLKNYDKVYEELKAIVSEYSENKITDSVYRIARSYERLSNYSDKYRESAEKMNDYYYELREMETAAQTMVEDLNFDPAKLDEIQQRLYELDKLSEKYHRSLPELVAYLEELKKIQEESEDYDQSIQMLADSLEKQREKVKSEALSLSEARKEIAGRITRELMLTLIDLSLPNTLFEVRFTTPDDTELRDIDKYRDDGIDVIDFYLSTNVGEPLKPLAKAASGGEMSRIMLGLKTIFIRSEKLGTMIFDEIDTGISGRIAKQIGKKLKQVAENCQVLAITHIPQVVAMGDRHLKVLKADQEKRTTASARYLDFDGRIAEIAAMISGEKTSESSVESARELLLEE